MIQFNPEQFQRLIDGHKRQTIRRGVRKVSPGPVIAACTASDDLAVIIVKEVAVRCYKDLNLTNALAEGYTTEFEMRRVLEAIYPGVNDTDYMTIITIDKVVWSSLT